MPIKRNCRYALVPQPVASSVVRNFTSLAVPLDELPKFKTHLKQQDYIKEFLKVDLPDLNTVEAIDESFRKLLFAQWVVNDNSKKFSDLKTKFQNLTGKPQFKRRESLDPTDYELVKATVGALITDIDVNKTHGIHVLVPHDLRLALFEGWEEQGYSFARMLYHYGK